MSKSNESVVKEVVAEPSGLLEPPADDIGWSEWGERSRRIWQWGPWNYDPDRLTLTFKSTPDHRGFEREIPLEKLTSPAHLLCQLGSFSGLYSEADIGHLVRAFQHLFDICGNGTLRDLRSWQVPEIKPVDMIARNVYVGACWANRLSPRYRNRHYVIPPETRQ